MGWRKYRSPGSPQVVSLLLIENKALANHILSGEIDLPTLYPSCISSFARLRASVQRHKSGMSGHASTNARQADVWVHTISTSARNSTFGFDQANVCTPATAVLSVVPLTTANFFTNFVWCLNPDLATPAMQIVTICCRPWTTTISIVRIGPFPLLGRWSSYSGEPKLSSIYPSTRAPALGHVNSSNQAIPRDPRPHIPALVKRKQK